MDAPRVTKVEITQANPQREPTRQNVCAITWPGRAAPLKRSPQEQRSRMIRRHIKPGTRLAVKLSPGERDLVIERAFLDTDIETRRVSGLQKNSFNDTLARSGHPCSLNPRQHPTALAEALNAALHLSAL